MVKSFKCSVRWKEEEESQGPLPPTRSVLFVDNTAGGELARRFQMAEEEAGELSGYIVRISESSGTALACSYHAPTHGGPSIA